ncbi:MAG: hypothetical protein IPJ03_08380 [Ignavibacteriales bacterium]|nr:hypothetical protein [Ignavibacteriales bacterium]
MRDNKDDLFKKVAFTAGYKITDLKNISFSSEELKQRYTSNSEEVEKGIYIVNRTSFLYGDEKLSQLSKPNSMLVMAVERKILQKRMLSLIVSRIKILLIFQPQDY